MGIVLLLGAAFALLALAGKKDGSEGSSGLFGPGDVEKFTWGTDPKTGAPKSFAKLTRQGKEELFALFEQGWVVMPQMGVPSESEGTFLPLARSATGAVGMNANDYIASLLDTTDVTVWVDSSLNGIVVAEGPNQALHGYPLVMLTTGAEGWPAA